MSNINQSQSIVSYAGHLQWGQFVLISANHRLDFHSLTHLANPIIQNLAAAGQHNNIISASGHWHRGLFVQARGPVSDSDAYMERA